MFKTLYLMGPGGLVNQGYVNFKKNGIKAGKLVHVPRFKIVI